MVIRNYIIIHHSLSDDGPMLNTPAIRKYHKGKGWDNIGYHFIIEKYRGRYETVVGRRIDGPGAHCVEEFMNTRSFGICLVGDFDAAPPDDAQMNQAALLVRSLIGLFNIPKKNVLPHRHFAPYKSCPGKLFPWDAFKAKL